MIISEKIDPSQYQIPKNPVKKALFIFIKKPIFETIIMIFIIANVVVLALDEYDLDSNTVRTLEILNYIFTLIFLIEALLKIII